MPGMDGRLGDMTTSHRNGDVVTGVHEIVTSALKVELNEDEAETVMLMANDKALNYKYEMGGTGNYDDCVQIVAAECAAMGDAIEGPVAAALGTGGGIPAAALACGRIYKKPE